MVKIVIIAENEAQQGALSAEFGAAIARGSTGLETSGATLAEIKVFNDRSMDALSGTPKEMKQRLADTEGSSKDQLIITTAGRVKTGLFSSQPVGEFLQQTYGDDVTVVNAAGVDAKTIKAGVEGMILSAKDVELDRSLGQISAAAQARFNQALQERQRGGAEALFDERADPGRKGGEVNFR